MQAGHVFVGGVAFLLILTHPANCQPFPGDQAPPQIRKDWVLGQRVAHDLEQKDGRVNDPAIGEYLERVENRIAARIGSWPVEVRVTRSAEWYASLLPNRVLYISGGLLQRIENEAELAGLLAHELAHVREQARGALQGEGAAWRGCILASPLGNEDAREREMNATTAAFGYLKSAGYYPTAVLDLFSKLAYEHPAWATAILPKDLLEARAKTDADTVPAGGYRVDGSEFLQLHARLETALGHPAREDLKKRPGRARP